MANVVAGHFWDYVMDNDPVSADQHWIDSFAGFQAVSYYVVRQPMKGVICKDR